MSPLLVKFFLVTVLISLGSSQSGNGTSGGGGGAVDEPVDPQLEGFSQTQETVLAEQTAKTCVTKVDPWYTKKCWPRPWWLWPDPHITNLRPLRYCRRWPWLKAVKTTIKMAEKSKDAREALNDIPAAIRKEAESSTDEDQHRTAQNLEVADQLLYDWREYYWKMSCPYSNHYLCKFWHRRLRWCWIVAPHWFQRTRYARCRTPRCNIRCKGVNPRIKNSVCFPANYRYYRRYVYCPWANKKCRKRPWKCFYWLTLKLPQCCECWHCWFMGVTRVLHDVKASPETKAKMFQIDGEEEGEGGEGEGNGEPENPPDDTGFMPPEEEPPQPPLPQ